MTKKYKQQPTGFVISAKSFFSLVTDSGVLSLSTDLKFDVIEWSGCGLPPVNNIFNQLPRGGSLYNKSIYKDRVITLSGFIFGNNFSDLADKLKVLRKVFALDTSTDSAPNLYLRFQPVNDAGVAYGTALDIAVVYAEGLEGKIDNPYSYKINLKLIAIKPDDIKASTVNTVSLPYREPVGNAGIFEREPNGIWDTLHISSNVVYCIGYDNNNRLLWGKNNGLYYDTGTVGTSVSGNHNCIIFDQSNNYYVGLSDISSNTYYVRKWNGSSWSQLGTNLNGGVFGLVLHTSGILYAVGDFTTPANRFAYWNGSTWATTGGTGFNAKVYCVIRGLDNCLYIGGNFTTANGTTVNRIVKYAPATNTYTALGSGMNGVVTSIAVGPDGRIYAAGDFTTAGGITANRIAVWNGTNWLAVGQGFNGIVNKIVFDANGTLWATGMFNASGTTGTSFQITQGVAKWSGSVWLPIDFESLYGAGSNTSMAAATNGNVCFGDGTSASYQSALTVVNNLGSGEATPQLVFTGPGILYSVINNTTGKALYFNYTMLAGETLTLDFNPFNFTSSMYGNIKSKIIPGSDISKFKLKPGNNNISCFISGSPTGATSATLKYKNTYFSLDSAV